MATCSKLRAEDADGGGLGRRRGGSAGPLVIVELPRGPVLFELADPDADEVERGFVIEVIVALSGRGSSFDGLSLLVRARELLLFNT